MSDPIVPPGEEQYWRYNPKFLNKYVEQKGEVDLAELTNREPPGPMLVQLVDSVIQLTPSVTQRQWSELRPFILDPGNPAQLHAAADAWRPDGASGGTGSAYKLLNTYKNELQRIMQTLADGWSDQAASSLSNYIIGQVGTACFEALDDRVTSISAAIRAMAVAQETLQASIDDAASATAVAAVATVVTGTIATGATTVATAGTAGQFAAGATFAAAATVVASFVTWAFSSWSIYKTFIEACRASLDRLGVESKILGDGHGRWPRPWNT